MAAARIAAERGHSVTLFEASEALGGQNLMTAQVASRRGFSEIHRWQAEMLGRLNIAIRLRTTADRAVLISGNFDAAVIATGSVPRRDGYTSLRPQAAGIVGADADHVFTSWDVFQTPEAFTGPVIVMEDDPHLAGTAAAEKLAERGHRVTIVTPHMHAGADLPVHHAPALYRRLAALGIAVIPGTFVTAIEPGGLVCEGRFDGSTRRIAHDGQIVLAMGSLTQDPLSRELEGSGLDLFLVGDALAPRQVDMAILDGERAGWMI